MKTWGNGLLNLLLILTILTQKAHASSVSDSIMPLIDILQDLAEPVSYGYCIKGLLSLMAGDENSGKKAIKASIGGFIGIRWLPQLFAIIKKINF